MRVVAPTSVNGGTSSVSVRAAGPWPTMMSSRKSSSAGYSTSSTARFSRWISSTNSTSRDSSAVRIAAMSPFRSSAGPAIVRMPTPSSSRMMNASDVLPSPGGPTSSTWSSASPREMRRVQRDAQLLLHALLADEVLEAARPERPLDLVVLRLERGREELLGHAALSAWRTRSSAGRSGSTSASARSASTTE